VTGTDSRDLMNWPKGRCLSYPYFRMRDQKQELFNPPPLRKATPNDGTDATRVGVFGFDSEAVTTGLTGNVHAPGACAEVKIGLDHSVVSRLQFSGKGSVQSSMMSNAGGCTCMD